MTQSLVAAFVAKGDPDRFATTQFVASDEKRRHLLALYAFNSELSQLSWKATEPTVVEFRFAWWRDCINEGFSGGALAAHHHDIVDELAMLGAATGFTPQPLL